MDQAGKYAFIAGVVLAVVAAFINQSWTYTALAVLGLAVGVLNITASETKTFLLAAIGLMLSAASIVQLPIVGEEVTRIANNLIVFISPAMLVVALKSLFEVAKD